MCVYRSLVLVGILAACSALNSWEIPEGNLLDYVNPDMSSDWLRFKKDYNRSYSDTYEELKRRYIWEEAHRFFADHNKRYEQGEFTYTVGENDFADLTYDEFKKYYLSGLVLPEGVDEQGRNEDYEVELKQADVDDVDDEIDWVKNGYVTPVKNQGYCGSCWAFSALGALESAFWIKYKYSIDLSEQQLVDCASHKYGYGCYGCRGGWMAEAYRYIKRNRGIGRESCYPYHAKDGRCRRPSCIGATILKYKETKTEAELQKNLKKGPVAIACNVDDQRFMSYKSGIYNNPYCSRRPNHAMVAVGYGRTACCKFWLIKNSWGTSWGDGGYIKMTRDGSNQCGIDSFAVQPKVG